MSVILGSGDFRYRVVEDWAKLPDGWEFRDVAAVGVDSKDQVYVFNRGDHPMIVFDRDGHHAVACVNAVDAARIRQIVRDVDGICPRQAISGPSTS